MKHKFKLITHNTKEQMGWGSNDDTREHLLLGVVYECEVEPHSWHTKLLIGDKKFNSVCFEEVTDKPVSFSVATCGGGKSE